MVIVYFLKLISCFLAIGIGDALGIKKIIMRQFKKAKRPQAPGEW